MAREVFVIKIGPLMKEVLDKQKDKIKDATYDVVEPDSYEVCEILAKKILDSAVI